MSSFAQLNLNSDINKAITACGYINPTPIQAKSIPDILQGKDMVASAQTGTGKTAAFVLPALQRLSTQEPSKKTRILILTPTRELANQILKAAATYGKFMRFNIVSLVGGMPYHHQIKDLARGADIIVATPGRLMDHMEQKRVDLSGIEMLVLDEADRMLDMGFIEDVEYIAKLTPSNRQTLLFSATVDKQLSTVVRHLLKNPVRIDLSSEKIAAPQIKQELYKANNAHHKMRLLKHFLSDANIYKAIIFSATKVMADKLAIQLRDQGLSAAALHGDLKQNVRNRTIEQLRRGKIQFLVATDVAARGLDISDITHVINFDMPRFCEDYVHRIGRTGRAGKDGIAISFVLPTDLRHLQRIERYIGQRFKVINHVEMSDATLLTDNEKLSYKKEFHVANDRHDRDEKDNSREGYRSRKSHAGSDKSYSADRNDGYRSKRTDATDRDQGYRSKRTDSSDRSEGYRSKRTDSDRSEGYRSKRNDSDRSEGYRSKRTDSSDRSESYRSKRSDGADRDQGYRSKRTDSSDRNEGYRSKRSDGANRSEGYRSKRTDSSDSKESTRSQKKIYTVGDREGSAGNNASYRPKNKFGSEKRAGSSRDRRDSNRETGAKKDKPFGSFKKRVTKKTRWISNDGQGVQVE